MTIPCRDSARWRVAALAVLALGGCQPTNQGYEPEQPIAFSHAVHAGGKKIPCLYCHYGAERGPLAGIPSASSCMGCHAHIRQDYPDVRKVARAIEANEPIRWVKVHRLPDHVAFNHRAHVQSGVACQICHGPVESMSRVAQYAPLTMGWCVSCHRERQGAQSGALLDCAVCHH